MDLEKVVQARAFLFSGKVKEAIDAYRQAFGLGDDSLHALVPADGNEESAILEMGAAYLLLAEKVFAEGKPGASGEVLSLVEQGLSVNKSRSFVTGPPGGPSIVFSIGPVLVQAGVMYLRRGIDAVSTRFDEDSFFSDAVTFLSFCLMAASIEFLPPHVLEYARESAFLLLHVHKDHQCPDSRSFCLGRFGRPVYEKMRAEGVAMDGTGPEDSKVLAALAEVVFYRKIAAAPHQAGA